jgi:hypothetical protein
MWPEKSYRSLDRGIRFAVRVLHARGFETCQSCQGGNGHAYDHPTVDLVARGDDATGFGALAALRDYGLSVAELSIVWPIRNGHPYEKLWRITFDKTMEDRADEKPMFVYAITNRR